MLGVREKKQYLKHMNHHLRFPTEAYKKKEKKKKLEEKKMFFWHVLPIHDNLKFIQLYEFQS